MPLGLVNNHEMCHLILNALDRLELYSIDQIGLQTNIVWHLSLQTNHLSDLGVILVLIYSINYQFSSVRIVVY